jgi:hypothetical protein
VRGRSRSLGLGDRLTLLFMDEIDFTNAQAYGFDMDEYDLL